MCGLGSAIQDLQEDGFRLKMIPDEDITEEMCMVAVQQNGYALVYVPERFISLELLKICCETSDNPVPWAVRLMMNRGAEFSDEILLYGCSQDGLLLLVLPKHLITKEVIYQCCDQNGLAIQSVPSEFRCMELYKIACLSNCLAITFIPPKDITIDMMEWFISGRRYELSYIPVKNMEGFYQDHFDQWMDLLMRSVMGCGFNIKDIPKEVLTGEICLAAIKSDSRVLAFIPVELVTLEMCTLSVEARGENILSCGRRQPELAVMSIQSNWKNLQYIRPEYRTIELGERIQQLGGMKEANEFLKMLSYTLSNDGEIIDSPSMTYSPPFLFDNKKKFSLEEVPDKSALIDELFQYQDELVDDEPSQDEFTERLHYEYIPQGIGETSFFTQFWKEPTDTDHVESEDEINSDEINSDDFYTDDDSTEEGSDDFETDEGSNDFSDSSDDNYDDNYGEREEKNG